MSAVPVKIDFWTFLQNAPDARQQVLRGIEDMNLNGARNQPRAVAPAPPARTPARVPFPSFPAPRPAPAAGPSVQPQGAVPMEHMMDTEEAYFADRPQSINTVVRAPVYICNQLFDGILDTGASDSAISINVVRKLCLMNDMVPSGFTTFDSWWIQ